MKIMTLLSWMVVLVLVVVAAAEDIMLLLIIGVFYFYICFLGYLRPPVLLTLINSFGSLNKV
jgi:hypothetical protein